MECYTFVYLLREALVRSAVPRMKRLVITISTAPGPYGSIAVGTGKTRINHYFLQTGSVFLYEKTGK
jgi:hypothetical protein